MSTFAPTLRYLYSLQYRGMKLGLRNTRELLRMAGNPERRLRSIHVAGTNGKGSTSSYIASILQESGFRVGLYTSPHLIRFSERIRINGAPIEELRIASYVRGLKPAIEATRATFFEATTCLAFCYFADEGVDYAVIETGLGGRLDSTNVIIPLVSVIATIALDHTQILGTNLRSIAREKGGIIKAGVPCVTSVTDRGVLATLDSIATSRRTRVSRSYRMVTLIPSSGNRVRLRSRSGDWRTGAVAQGLQGAHQNDNAVLASAACLLWSRSVGSVLRPQTIARGITNVVRNTRLRGRKEKKGRFVFDVAHNPEGATALAASFQKNPGQRPVIIIGMMKDKDLPGIIKPLGDIAQCFVTVTPPTERGLPESALRKQILDLGYKAYRGGGVRAGLSRALRIAEKRQPVLVTGSHYVVGAALGQFSRPGA